MKNIIDLLKLHVWKVTTVIFLLLFLSKGCTSNKVTKLEKDYDSKTLVLERKIDSLQTKLDKMPTTDQVKDAMEKVMFDYLVYSEKSDAKKASLSDIKKSLSEIKNKMTAKDELDRKK